MIIGGFYLLAYLYWYIPALVGLPESVLTPPATFPWHWTLDFVATGLAGIILVFLGFRTATRLMSTTSARKEGSEYDGQNGDG